MDLESVLDAYRRHAPYYDAVFGVLLHPGRQQTVKLANRVASGRVLEVGVGTGLSLSGYRDDLTIVGIDVSEEMLKIARRRVAQKGLRNVESLLRMDAENLDFADDSFDTIAAMYVASVVPHPERFVSEMQRVCRPGGQILIVNHFAEEGGIRGSIEKKLVPLSRKLGWRPDFEMEPFLRGTQLEIVGSRRAAPLGLFTVLHCRNAKPASAGDTADRAGGPLRRAAGGGR